MKFLINNALLRAGILFSVNAFGETSEYFTVSNWSQIATTYFKNIHVLKYFKWKTWGILRW